jgi:hypothetical protein
MLDMNASQTPTQPTLPPHISMPSTPIPPGPHLSSLASPTLLPPPGVIPSVSLSSFLISLPLSHFTVYFYCKDDKLSMERTQCLSFLMSSCFDL